MFLSKTLLKFIEKKKSKKIKSNQIAVTNIKILSHKINYLKKIKKNKIKYISNLGNFEYTINKKLVDKIHFSIINTKIVPETKNNLLSYIMTINFNSTNTRIYISDIKGNIIKSYSAGLVKLTGKQKTKRYVAIINLLRKILVETKTLQKTPITLHIKNITKHYPLKRIIKLIKNKFLLLSIKSFNNKPYNGCRPKKTKRLK